MTDVDLLKEFVIAAHGDLGKVKHLLAAHPELLNEAYDWGSAGLETAIGAAAHVGNRVIAEFLLQQGAPLEICTAAMLGRNADVQTFLESNEELANARGAHGIPVMFHAALGGRTDIAELLKSRGCKEGYNSALHAAVMFGHLDMINWLLENGADDVNPLNFRSETPLQVAMTKGYDEIAEILRLRGGHAGER